MSFVNESKNTSVATNEAKNTSAVTNERETNPPTVFGVATFGQSRFGKGQAGQGTPFTNETKNS